MAVSPHLTEGEVMIIRQDWLDKLGLKAPTTIDEFEEVIRAFTEDDPDGNGQKDTGHRFPLNALAYSFRCPL